MRWWPNEPYQPRRALPADGCMRRLGSTLQPYQTAAIRYGHLGHGHRASERSL